MKFLTLAIVAFICLGWQTDLISSYCNPTHGHMCIQSKVNCSEVSRCYLNGLSCWVTNPCLEKTYSCQSTLRIMEHCTRHANCTDKFFFRDTVEQKCSLKTYMNAGTSIHTEFAATTLLLASYYFLG